jgi:branched-chain amino acid transport system substrate-binding protein
MKRFSLQFLQLLIGCTLASLVGCGRPQQDTGEAKLHVVVIAPLTGPGASLGELIRNGVEIGRAEVAQRYGTKLQLNVEFVDSKNQPKEGLSAYQAAKLQNKPDAVISAMSSVAKALQPIVESDKIFTVATTTALSGLPQGTNYVVRVYPTSDDFVALTADYMADRFSRIGVMYVNDDFGKSNEAAFRQHLTAKSKEIAVEDSFELTQTDHRNSIQRLLAGGPDALFVTGYGPAYIALMKQIRESAPAIPLFTEMSLANPAVLSALGNVADGVIFAGTDLELTEPKSAPAQAFKAAYRDRFHADTFMVAGFARDSLDLIVNASFKDGGFVGPGKASAIALSPINGCVGAIQLDQAGESHIPLRLMQRKGDRTVPVE